MHNSHSDKFLMTLWNVLDKESMIVKTQKIRLNEILKTQWKGIDFQIPLLSDFSIDKVSFFSDIRYRIQLLHLLNIIFNQALGAILRIVEVLLIYYPNSSQCHEMFQDANDSTIRFIIAENLLGSLLPVIPLCDFSLDVDLIIYSSMKSILSLTGLTTAEIQEKLSLFGIHASVEEISQKLESSLGKSGANYIHQHFSESDSPLWKLTENFSLSEKSKRKYVSNIAPLINWAVSTWRSLYNIRELDTPILDDYPQANGLRQVVARAATQGFSAASEVVQNLEAYYQYLAKNI